jgi:hypothetical protein
MSAVTTQNVAAQTRDVFKSPINLPFVGGVSIAALAIGGGIIWLLARRKKEIRLKV